MRRLALVMVLLALVTPAGVRGQGIICDDIASTVKLNACLDTEYVKADSELNLLYQKTLAALVTDTTQRGTLIRSQEAWLAYRDRQRELREAFAGGENPHGSLMWGMISMTWDRLGFLSPFAKNRYPPGEPVCQYMRF